MIDAKVGAESPQITPAVETPAVLTTSSIIADLENGIDRDGIAVKYGLTPAEVKTIFMHPTLKGLRVKKNKLQALRFKLIDDVNGVADTDPNQLTIESPEAMVNLDDSVGEPKDEDFQVADQPTPDVNEDDDDIDTYLKS